MQYYEIRIMIAGVLLLYVPRDIENPIYQPVEYP